MIVLGRYVSKMIRNKKAEQERIRDGEEAYEKQINRTTRFTEVGRWRYDACQDRFYWSEEAYQIHGIIPLYMATALKDFLRMIHPDDRLKVLDGVIGCLEGKGYQVEYRIPQRNGEVKCVLSKGVPLSSEDQRSVGISGIVRAVSERNVKKAKKAL